MKNIKGQGGHGAANQQMSGVMSKQGRKGGKVKTSKKKLRETIGPRRMMNRKTSEISVQTT